VTPHSLVPEADLIVGRRLWAAMMLTPDVRVFESIVRGRPVLVRNLDAEALRRALRGMSAPRPDSFIRIRHGHLDALDECGPLLPERRRAA
jgi:hypothetical protein